MNPNAERVKAAYQRMMAADPNTTRFAGTALAATSLPFMGALLDDQEEGLGNALAAGAILYGGNVGG